MRIIGRIIGNRRSGEIVVETLDFDIYVLDRFSIVRRLSEDVGLFEIPENDLPTARENKND